MTCFSKFKDMCQIAEVNLQRFDDEYKERIDLENDYWKRAQLRSAMYLARFKECHKLLSLFVDMDLCNDCVACLGDLQERSVIFDRIITQSEFPKLYDAWDLFIC